MITSQLAYTDFNNKISVGCDAHALIAKCGFGFSFTENHHHIGVISLFQV